MSRIHIVPNPTQPGPCPRPTPTPTPQTTKWAFFARASDGYLRRNVIFYFCIISTRHNFESFSYKSCAETCFSQMSLHFQTYIHKVEKSVSETTWIAVLTLTLQVFLSTQTLFCPSWSIICYNKFKKIRLSIEEMLRICSLCILAN